MNAIVEFGGFSELCDWQAMLDRHREVFTEMDDGARIGIVSPRIVVVVAPVVRFICNPSRNSSSVVSEASRP